MLSGPLRSGLARLRDLGPRRNDYEDLSTNWRQIWGAKPAYRALLNRVGALEHLATEKHLFDRYEKPSITPTPTPNGPPVTF